MKSLIDTMKSSDTMKSLFDTMKSLFDTMKSLFDTMKQGGDREINKDIPSKFFLRPERRD